MRLIILCLKLLTKVKILASKRPENYLRKILIQMTSFRYESRTEEGDRHNQSRSKLKVFG